MKISFAVLLTVFAIPLTATAQTAVFKCEVDGHIVWSDNPCKSKGKVVKIKPVQSGTGKNGQANPPGSGAPTSPEKPPAK
ncbi:MAG: hypothetical protein KGM99_10070 [Burkholderiales bacterium]|nr:hypothetical protein [Burkholderiales bacterium]